jgi:hypothetical protein
VEGSAIAGVIGTRSFGLMRARVFSRPGIVFALLAATRMSDIPFEWRIGMFDSDSEPPAMAISMWPSAI